MNGSYRLLLSLLALLFVIPVEAQPLGGQRSFEPAVFTGADLTALQGLPPDSLAAFRYDTTGWTRIPSQVDEREYIDLAWAYDGRDGIRCDTSSVNPNCIGEENYGFVFGTAYTNTGTFVGNDTDPLFDFDDELVFMARDAGRRAPVGTPPPEGVYGPSGMEVVVALPAGDGSRPLPWYVYLFHHDGRYTAVDTAYVSYDYHLLSGDYLSTYVVGGDGGGQDQGGYALGVNPEDSWVETPYYRRHYSDRWIEDSLEVLVGTGVDLIDRVKYQRDLGHCARTENTGSQARGAMIAFKSGPVRAIRSVIGWNSGPFRQRDYFFYDRYARAVTYFRVHTVHGLLDYNDYTANAVGMTYTSNLSLTPRTVDGVVDPALEDGVMEWSILQGAQGTIVTTHFLETTIPDEVALYYGLYRDEAPSTAVQCTADENMYGSSGKGMAGELPNTDPSDTSSPAETLTYGWDELYAGPDLSAEDAQAFITAARTSPLFRRTRVYMIDAPVPPVAPVGGFARAEGEGAAGKAEAPAFELRLEAPRPNPASGRTSVVYELSTDGEATLELYDALGRRVAVLASGWQREGRHVAAMEAGGLASGVYVVRLVTPLGVRAVRLVRP